MAPTPAAKALIGPVREALALVRRGLDRQADFDPSASDRIFSVAIGDIAASVVVPAMARVMEAENARVAFSWLQMARPDIPAEFAAGQLDLVIDIAALARPELASVKLFSDRYVCVLRKGHACATGRFTLARFLSLRHITVSSRRTGRGVIDVALARVGERLRPAMRMAHFQTAFHAVMASDLALVAPMSLAERYDVAVRELPVDAVELDLMLFWRKDAEGDAGLAWARERIVRAAQTKAAAPRGRSGRGQPA
jgi:DNA-binding transcriptional LysR family regulator